MASTTIPATFQPRVITSQDPAAAQQCGRIAGRPTSDPEVISGLQVGTGPATSRPRGQTNRRQLRKQKHNRGRVIVTGRAEVSRFINLVMHRRYPGGSYFQIYRRDMSEYAARPRGTDRLATLDGAGISRFQLKIMFVSGTGFFLLGKGATGTRSGLTARPPGSCGRDRVSRAGVLLEPGDVAGGR